MQSIFGPTLGCPKIYLRTIWIKKGIIRTAKGLFGQFSSQFKGLFGLFYGQFKGRFGVVVWVVLVSILYVTFCHES